MRMPKLTITVAIVLLLILAGISGYAGYLVVGVVAGYLDIGRILTGILLSILFIRLPRLRQGKLSTIGILPKIARLPIVATLAALSTLHYFNQDDIAAVVCLILATTFFLVFRWLKLTLSSRLSSLFAKPGFGFGRSRSASAEKADPSIIDMEFREKRDE